MKPWGLLACGVVWVMGVALLWPSLDSWLMGDDIRNWRWALEFEYAPWKALTERHSVHDHIRPFTLMSVWLGLMISDGLYWGPQGVMLALEGLALAMFMGLARELSGRWSVGAVAGVLAISLKAFQRMPDWQAWLCSAGEMGLGLTALYALARSRRSERPWPWIGLMLASGASAGLYKEPGWVVWPAVAFALLLPDLIRGPRSLPRMAPLLWLPLAAIGFAYTWHPANAFRYEDAPEPLVQRVLGYLLSQPSLVVDPWPRTQWPGGALDALAPWTGVALPLLAVVMLAAVWGPERAAERPKLLLLCSLALGATFLGVPELRGPCILLMAAVGLLRSWRYPNPGFVMALAGYAVMMPVPGPNEVQTMPGALGLCLAMALALGRLWELSPGWPAGLRLSLGGLVALGLGVELVQDVQRLERGDLDSGTRLERRAELERFVGYGAVAAELGLSTVVVEGELGQLDLAPMLGLEVLQDLPEGSFPGFELNGSVLVLGNGKELLEPLMAKDLLQGKEVPRFSAVDHRSLSRPGGEVGRRALPAGRGLSVDLSPGWYALGGTLKTELADGELLLTAADACGHIWDITSGGSPVQVSSLWLREGCGPLRIALVEMDNLGFSDLFLSPIRPAVRRFRGLPQVPRRLELGVVEGGRVEDMFEAPGAPPQRTTP